MMNKRKLVTIVALVGLAGILTTSPNMTQVKADHCHPSHTKTTAAPATPAKSTTPSIPATPTNKLVRTTVPNPERQRKNTRVLSINNKQFRTDVFNIENKPVGPETLSFEEIYSRDFPIAISSIGQAVKAIQSGDRQTELNELSKALDKLITVHKALGTQLKPQYANSIICPIMGSPIDINTVDGSLTRRYKGRKIAFCCAGCPSAWDKLTEIQKQTKVPGLKL